MKTYQAKFSDGTYGEIKTDKTPEELLTQAAHPGWDANGEMNTPEIVCDEIYTINGIMVRDYL
jgi:hypothetical protein